MRVWHVKIQSHVVDLKTLFPAHPLNPIFKFWTFGPSGTVKRNSTKCYYLPCSLSDKLFDKKVESISLDNWTNSKRLEIQWKSEYRMTTFWIWQSHWRATMKSKRFLNGNILIISSLILKKWPWAESDASRKLLKELTFDWEEVPSFVIIGIYMAIYMVHIAHMIIGSHDHVTWNFWKTIKFYNLHTVGPTRLKSPLSIPVLSKM